MCLVLAITFVSMSACSTFLDLVVSRMFDSEDETEYPEATVGRESKTGIVTASPLIAMPHTALFNMAYMQVFTLGAYSPDFGDFDEGQGVTWKITYNDGGDSTEILTERALLKRGPGGSWWYVAYESEGEELQYEVQMDNEGVPRELLWQNPDGTVFRYTYDEDQPAMPARGPDDDDRFDDRYRRGTRRVTVGAGTYTAEYIVYDFDDPESGQSVEYHWWVVEDVPGTMVKYEYRGTAAEESAITGELLSVDSGYRTVFGSY